MLKVFILLFALLLSWWFLFLFGLRTMVGSAGVAWLPCLVRLPVFRASPWAWGFVRLLELCLPIPFFRSLDRLCLCLCMLVFPGLSCLCPFSLTWGLSLGFWMLWGSLIESVVLPRPFPAVFVPGVWGFSLTVCDRGLAGGVPGF